MFSQPSVRATRIARLISIILLSGAVSATAAEPKKKGGRATRERLAEVVERKPDSTNGPIARIREEGMNHSQVMDTLAYLTEAIGPRLTGSPNLKRANEWTRDQLASWGLTNAHLEAWGPFGRGWELKSFSAQVLEPQAIPLIAYPNAWSPGLEKPLVAEVIYFDAKTNSDLEKFKGKLEGKIVLNGALRELGPVFEPPASRLADTNLLRLANAAPSSESDTNRVRRPRSSSASVSTAAAASATNAVAETNSATNGTPASPDRPAQRGRFRQQSRFLYFLQQEGVALIVNPSSQGDGGILYVVAATVPVPETQGTNSTSTNTVRAWSTNAPAIPPQITLASEPYNHLVRMVQHEQKLKMAVDLQVKFHDEDVMAYNTIAELPGSDLKDELVMVGAHMDSWHSGTGATDNGAGVAATMEAVRILSALELHPRRTIRIALWTGEEQGLFGSKAYVSNHFGYYTNATNSIVREARGSETGRTDSADETDTKPERRLVHMTEYGNLSAYFNLDNGGGKIRGVYMQGNEAVRPLFRKWLEPFADLGAETLTLANTGGTDHLPFDGIGLPGFQFIQDPIEYNTRTHHSNNDVLDRVQADDLKQAATIIAAFLYDTAMRDDKLPRKQTESP